MIGEPLPSATGPGIMGQDGSSRSGRKRERGSGTGVDR
ncbi:hypothetical protein ATKI12_5025 [Kitasatospora sp. Ki12]